MGAEETRHDLWLKRINTWVGILAVSRLDCWSLQFSPLFFSGCSGRYRGCRPRAGWCTCSARPGGAFDLAKCFARHFSDGSRRPLR